MKKPVIRTSTALTLIILSLTGCYYDKIPQVAIPSDASCEYVLQLHREAVDYARERVGKFSFPAAMKEVKRIEDILHKKGCSIE